MSRLNSESPKPVLRLALTLRGRRTHFPAAKRQPTWCVALSVMPTVASKQRPTRVVPLPGPDAPSSVSVEQQKQERPV